MEKITAQCEICFQEGMLQKAVKFCLDCNQPMCACCVNNHGKFRPLQSHKMITVDDYAKTPAVVHNVSELCDSHLEERKDYVCKDHNTCICFICLKDQHKLCKSIEKLTACTLVNNLKTDLELLNGKYVSSLDMVNKLIHLYTTKIQEIKSAATFAQNKIKDFVNRVQSYFSKYRQQIDNNLLDECAKLKRKVNQCEDIKRSIAKDRDLLKAFIDYGNDLKIFIKLKDFVLQHNKTEELLQGIEKTQAHTITFSFEMLPVPLEQIVKFTIQTTPPNVG